MMDSIPAPIQAVLALFTKELADVKFPDVDVDVLQLAAEEVHSAAGAVSRAEAALATARAALSDRQEALLAKAQRALAYARVFAEEDTGLAPHLESIVLPRPRRQKAEGDTAAPAADIEPARRQRPAKSREGTAPVLFESEPAEATRESPLRRRPHRHDLAPPTAVCARRQAFRRDQVTALSWASRAHSNRGSATP